jgi:hypothetical protein
MWEHTQRGQFTARLEPGEGVSYLVVSPENTMKLEAIEILLHFPNLLSLCRHAGVTTVQLPHDLVDNGLRVTAVVKSLNPELGGDA